MSETSHLEFSMFVHWLVVGIGAKQFLFPLMFAVECCCSVGSIVFSFHFLFLAFFWKKLG